MMSPQLATVYKEPVEPAVMQSGFRLKSPLGLAIVVSVALHVVLLAVKFVPPAIQAIKASDSPLEVVLVNAKSVSKPVKPEALAQANLDGGGNAKNGRVATPLPPTVSTQEGDSVIETRKKIEQLEVEKRKLMTDLKERKVALEKETDKKPDAEPMQDSGQDLMDRARQLAKLDGAIERTTQHSQKEPRRAQISANTRETVYAMYYAQLRERIEKRGTLNFPQINGQKLYGELVLAILIKPDGSIKQIELREASGNPELDKRAQAIVYSSAPFGHFTAEIAAQYDELEVISKFKFTRDDGLETSTQSYGR